MDLFEMDYSVDMIKIRTEVHMRDFQNFRDEVYLKSGYDEFKTDDLTQYFWNLNLETKENGSFWCGYLHNSKFKGHKYWYDFVVEFNPNKCQGNKFLDKILGRFFYDDYEIVSCDVAIDLYDIDITNIIPLKSGKRRICNIDYGGSNKTFYIGSKPNQVKIYNKAKEKGLPEDDLSWTRYEVSFEVGCKSEEINKFTYSGYLPKVYYITQSDIDKLDLNISEKYIVYAALKGKPLDDLYYRKKKKIENALAEHSRLEVEKCTVQNTLKKYVNFLKDYSKQQRQKQRKNAS